MASPIVVIVTGAVWIISQDFAAAMILNIVQNRGIGEAICQTLANNFHEPLILYATSRKGVDLRLKPDSSTTQVKYPLLDIADIASIQSLARAIRNDHLGLDVLINNAGVNLDDEYSPANVKKTLDTNYRGTLNVNTNSELSVIFDMYKLIV